MLKFSKLAKNFLINYLKKWKIIQIAKKILKLQHEINQLFYKIFAKVIRWRIIKVFSSRAVKIIMILILQNTNLYNLMN